ncbi:hypothetical protein RCL1_002956 [Eukaryota sp. TZLM3-RCL]
MSSTSKLLEMAYNSIRQREQQQPSQSAPLETPKPLAPIVETSAAPVPSNPPIPTPPSSTINSSHETIPKREQSQPTNTGYSARYRPHSKKERERKENPKSAPRRSQKPNKPEQQPPSPKAPAVTSKPVKRRENPKSVDVELTSHDVTTPSSHDANTNREGYDDEFFLESVEERLSAFSELHNQSNLIAQFASQQQSLLESLFKQMLQKWSDERLSHFSEVEHLSKKMNELERELENERNRRQKTEDMLEQAKQKCHELVHQLGTVDNSSFIPDHFSSDDVSTAHNSQRNYEPIKSYSNRTPTFRQPDPEMVSKDDLIERIKREFIKDRGDSEDDFVPEDHPIHLVESLRKRLDSEQYERLKTEEQTASMLAAEEQTIAILEAKLRSLEVQLYSKEGKKVEKKREEVIDLEEELSDDIHHVPSNVKFS